MSWEKWNVLIPFLQSRRIFLIRQNTSHSTLSCPDISVGVTVLHFILKNAAEGSTSDDGLGWFGDSAQKVGGATRHRAERGCRGHIMHLQIKLKGPLICASEHLKRRTRYVNESRRAHSIVTAVEAPVQLPLQSHTVGHMPGEITLTFLENSPEASWVFPLSCLSWHAGLFGLAEPGAGGAYGAPRSYITIWETRDYVGVSPSAVWKHWLWHFSLYAHTLFFLFLK